MKTLITGVLAVWFLVVLILGSQGVFSRPPGVPPLPIAFGALTPLIAFAIAYAASGAFRRVLLSADLRLLTMLQAWRFAGLGFIALSANGVLPETFTMPAGWGDIAIGVTAPWVALALVKRPAFAGHRLFVIWNILGMADLISAVITGTLSSGLFPAWSGATTTAPMSRLPLVMIPAFFVPLLFILHIVALLQARRAATAPESAPAGGAPGFSHATPRAM